MADRRRNRLILERAFLLDKGYRVGLFNFERQRIDELSLALYGRVDPQCLDRDDRPNLTECRRDAD